MTELDDETLAFAHRVFDFARSGEADELRSLISQGLSPDLTNDKGDTLLILAAYHDHPATVAALVEAEADIERVNDRGQTALAAAVFRKSEPSVRTLLDAGADVNNGNPSALEVATFFELPEMLELLQ
jgi:ankyrin repeat protein